MAPATDRERLEEYERSFRHDGLPLFNEDISAFEDVFNRAAPLLGLVFLGEMLGAGDLDWEWWQNLLAVAGGLALLLIAVGLVNRAQGRTFSTIPQRIGKTELAGFVLIPALLPLIFGGQVGSALVTIAANLALLGLIYAVGALALIAIVRWVFRRFASQLRTALTLLARAVPLLAIFVLLSFPTQELWLIFTDPRRGVYAVMIGLLALLGTAFLIVRLPREARRLEQEARVDAPPLHRRQLLNVGLVMFVSQAIQVLLVSLMIGAFLTAFGVLAVDDEIRLQWIGSTGDEVLHFTLFGQRLELTDELLRVATGLAAFSGFYFSIAIFTDSTYRQEFLEEITSEMRRSFENRAEYLRLREGLTEGRRPGSATIDA
jgi:small neutral amino acid transporter SnatA (MarC family)